ncbi:hypothetical protein [Streptomyces sp. F001]|uniref:hypothetical protein n=1 Tax=Streptomyces sp. F001 TaxID=1510026 RepID=UPI001F116A46|nr:hypothetical protein [Streptomyces sp. F001]
MSLIYLVLMSVTLTVVAALLTRAFKLKGLMRSRLYPTFKYTVIALWACFVAGPFFWAMTTSFKNANAVQAAPPTFPGCSTSRPSPAGATSSAEPAVSM